MRWDRLFCAVVAVHLTSILAASAQTTNSWTPGADGNWEIGDNWSTGTPTNSNGANLIINATTKAVTVDAITVLSNAVNGCMTISNLVVSGPVGTINTLQLTNAGVATPLTVLSSATISSGGALLVTNASLHLKVGTGHNLLINGTADLRDGGEIVVTNSSDVISIASATGTTGSLAMVNSSLRAAAFYVGRNGLGTFNMSGSATTACSFAIIGSGTTATGTVVVAGGKLSVSSDLFVGGDAGSGQMVVSNATVETLRTTVGGNVVSAIRAAGTLTIGVGGKLTAQGSLRICPNNVSSRTSVVWIVGGELDVATNIAEFLTIGEFSRAAMIVSNGTVLVGTGSPASGLIVEPLGQLTLLGGTTRVAGNLEVGGGSERTGTVLVAGGTLINTNASAVLSLGPLSGVARMTVSNATVLARRVQLGTDNNFQGLSLLTIGSGGTLAAVGPLVLGALNDTGQVVVADGQLVVTNTPASVGAGSGFIVDGSVTLTNGSSLVVSNVTTVVGNSGSGSLTVFGGSMTVSNLIVGNLAGSRGTVTFAGGTNTVFSGITTLGLGLNSTGTVWFSGDQLTTTNTDIGGAGIGFMNMSGGVWLVTGQLNVGVSRSGTLTVAGGTLGAHRLGLIIGNASATVTTGTVWLTGGELACSNGNIVVAALAPGTLTVSNGVLRSRDMGVSTFTNVVGRFTVAGGTNSVYRNFTMGRYDCIATAIVNVVGGQLFVTNTTATAVLDVRSGTLTLSSGTLMVDRLVITNACARFIRTGGTLVTTTNIVDSALDADGDGIPNGSDLDPFNPADAGSDPDGDGFTNLQEFQAGTDPTNSASTFRITSITQVDTNIFITWETGIGRTNALERTAGTGGSYSTISFAPIFTVTNTTSTVTNFLDVGAATNVPAFYYRVRLVP